MRKLLVLGLLIAPLLLVAQSNSVATYVVSGKIIDKSSKDPIELCTVVFENKATNNIDFWCISNEKGKFSMEVAEGNYNISVKFMSYATKLLEVSHINKDIKLGTIEIEPSTEALTEVEINGKNKTYSLKPNKQTFYVSKDISAQASSASQILTNIPSVAVNTQGEITIKGQSNVLVLINGKTSTLSKNDALKSIPSGAIEKVEVLSHSGASYKASATGIINIILKKGVDEGFNASITGNVGFKELYGGLVNLNYKTEKVNLFTNTNFIHNKKQPLFSSKNEYYTNLIPTGYLNESLKALNPTNDFMTVVGAEFYLSKKSTLTTTVKYDNINRENNSETITEIFDASNTLIDSNSRKNDGSFDNEIYEFSVDFKQSFKNDEQYLAAYILYSDDFETYKNNFTNTSPSFNNQSFTQTNHLKNTEVSIQYNHPINESFSFKTGYLGEFGKAPFKYFENNLNEEIVYTDNLNSGFIEFEKIWDKFYLGVGVRGEFMEIETDYKQLNTTQTRHFNNLFPEVYFEYLLNDKNSFDISYSKSVARPGSRQLQPYEQKYSETQSFIGNIELDPMFINNVNLSYSYSGDKFSLIPTLYWFGYTDLMQLISLETSEKINGIPKILSTYQNIGTLDYYGLNLMAELKVSKNVSFTGNANFYNMDRKGVFVTDDNEIRDFTLSGYSGEFSLLTKIKIPKVFNFQFNVLNELDNEAAFSIRKANTYVNAAINRDILKDKATISLTVDDIFNSQQINRDIYDIGYFSKRKTAKKYQTVILSFTYRFNQSKQTRSLDLDKKEIKHKF